MEGEQPSVGVRAINARVRARITGQPPIPPRIGKYEVRDPIGKGGMGSVYAAYDPQLEREVAIKLVRNDRGRDRAAQRRLRREAQALAGLSHPNLVPVFEVGDFEGQVYLAMERVRGPNMRRWITATPRSPAQILEHWRSVGRALAHMHRHKLVHRDIKPDNAIVGDDDRVRLIDFGLVRFVEESDMSSTQSVDDDGSGDDDDDDDDETETLPHSRGVVGTVAYAAPEVIGGQAADPRADQYSMCVSIYEALCGERPAGPTNDGGLVPLVEGCSMSASVHAALSRGLSEHPAERFESIDALLAALEPPSKRRPRWVAWAATGALLLATSGAIAATQSNEAADPPAHSSCVTAQERISEFWSEPRVAELRARYQDPRQPAYVAPSWAATERLVETTVREWSEAWDQVCERAAREPDDRDLAYQFDCLEDAKLYLDALVYAAADNDPAQFSTAFVEQIRTNPEPMACLDVEVARAARRLPEDPAQRALVMNNHRRGLRDGVIGVSGYHERAIALTEQRAVDVDGSTLAKSGVLAHLGILYILSGRYADAARVLAESETSAESQRNDRAVVLATSWQVLLSAVDVTLADRLEVHQARATAALERAGNPVFLADYHCQVQAAVALLQGRPADAVDTIERTLAQLSPKRSSPLLLVSLRGILLDAVLASGDIERIIPMADELVTVIEQQLGPSHPRLIQPLQARADALLAQGHRQRGFDDHMRALELAEIGYPRQAMYRGRAHLRVAGALARAGEVERAHAQYVEALVSLDPEGGWPYPQSRAALIGLFELERKAGRLDAALAMIPRIIEVTGKLRRGAGTIQVLERVLSSVDDCCMERPALRAQLHFELAQALATAGRAVEAEERAEQAELLYGSAGAEHAEALAAVEAWRP